MEEVAGKKYSDGILKGKEETKIALEDEWSQERLSWMAEKKGLAKNLNSYKERAKVWDLQSEALDKEIKEKREENKTLAEVRRSKTQTKSPSVMSQATSSEIVS